MNNEEQNNQESPQQQTPSTNNVETNTIDQNVYSTEPLASVQNAPITSVELQMPTAPNVTPAQITPQPIITGSVGIQPEVTQPGDAPVRKELNATTLILQWLTYALWGWVLLPLIWVIFSIVFSFVGGNTVGQEIIYPIAAVVVLLPAAVTTDFFYSKREPQVKKGAELVIMIIHAVIFVLFGLGFLIGAVFSLVSILINTESSDSAIASMISCIIIALLYAVVAVRTIKPSLLRPGWNNAQE